MFSRSPISRFVSLLCAALIALPLFPVAQAHAQEVSYTASFDNNKDVVPVNVLVGQSRVINFDRTIERFSVSNPDVAEAILITPNQVLVNGKSFGQVNFIAWEQSGSRFLVFDVFVRANLSLIDSQIRALFPKDDIRLSQANGSVVLSGSVTESRNSERADAVVQAAGFKTVNMLQTPVNDMTQVQLQVRVAEVSRNRLRELGVSLLGSQGDTSFFSSGGGPGSLSEARGGSLTGTLSSALNLFIFNNAIGTSAAIRALQQQGALRALAEPNLIAMNGQQASFLAGGEIPIPIVQGGGDRSSVSIVFKEYGVRLNFKPTIIDEDHIRLELEPEVSTLDYANGVRFEGFTIPALRTRRAKTGVELRDGQSFALAGLLDNNETRSLSKIPGLGDIPILGALFRSKSFQRNETELMFIITAQLVRPVNRDDLPNLRGVDGLRNGSPLGIEQPGEGIQGASGHSITGASGNNSVAPAVTAPPAPAPTTPAAVSPGATVTAPTPQASVTAAPAAQPQRPAPLNPSGVTNQQGNPPAPAAPTSKTSGGSISQAQVP
ncbi:MAG: pilus assembly protein N-terminal domain-containing protein [Acidobacteriota bacterium]|nr:pilus assembly protein N-terminal domain-containing protein [Acidobacteriota bacterium]